MALPLFLAVTTPFLSTLATFLFDDENVTAVLLPLSSTGFKVIFLLTNICTFTLSNFIEEVSTVTFILSELILLETVISASPALSAFSVPSLLTDTTEVSLLA